MTGTARVNSVNAVRIATFVALGVVAAAACDGASGTGDNPTDDAGSPPGTVASPEAGSASGDAASPVGTPDATLPTDAGAAPPDATTPGPDANVPSFPGADASITAFNQTLICFGSGGSGPCSRTVDAQVTFPKTGTFTKIVLEVTLNCPPGGCDHWDRAGSIDLVTPPAQDGGAETLTELGRFVTPYNIIAGTNSPPVWDIDVTELRPLLAGTVTVRAFIDTWDPQGDVATNGGGWVLGAKFYMTGGTPAKEPIAVVPIWVWTTTGREPTKIPYGDPSNPISQTLPTQNVHLPAGAKSFGVRSTITGHGQANLDDCAEFCSRDHTWQVGSTANKATMFRTDCGNYPSSGTYTDPRAGWCPGAYVVPWDFDVTAQVGSGPTVPITYGVPAYTNTCNGTVCTGCAAGTSCGYDGSGHTAPFYYVQSLLIGFK